MYKKAIISLFVLHLIFALVIVHVKLREIHLDAASKNKIEASYISPVTKAIVNDFYDEGSVIESVTGERVILYEVIINDRQVRLSKEDTEILCRIVQAEAGNQDEKGKMLVAGVVLNRVNHPKFPNSVKEVVYSGGQFSPIRNGSFDRVRVTEQTRAAVDKVLAGTDVSAGALYFASRRAASETNMSWFDNHLTYLFQYGAHEFYK